MKLTKTGIEAIPIETTDRLVWDEALKGFGVKVTPAGKRVYLLQYRPNGSTKTRRYTIGRHGSPWTTEQARAAAVKLRARVDLGEDPYLADRETRDAEGLAEATRAEQEEERRAEATRLEKEAFPLVVDDFIKLHAKPKNRSWAESERILTSNDVVEWRNRAVSSIKRREVMEIVDAATRRAPSAGRLLFAQLSRFFSWCSERQLVEVSPCMGVRAPPAAKSRDRVLSDDELRRVWRATITLPAPFGSMMQLLALTGQRREEVGGMRWSEVDMEALEWVLPAGRVKNAKAHAVDLAPPALAVLMKVRKGTAQLGRRRARADRAHVSGDLEINDFVFTTTGTSPISGHSKMKRVLDARIAADAAARGRKPMPPWRIHDLRRTAATGMASLGYPPHVVEAVLNHRSGALGGLTRVYQHYDHRSERRAALLAWGAHVERLLES